MKYLRTAPIGAALRMDAYWESWKDSTKVL